MPLDDDDKKIAQALTDAGGPPELAPQLVAITRKHGARLGELERWISWHGGEWSAAAWSRHCERSRVRGAHE
jgi:hypothetical protein